MTHEPGSVGRVEGVGRPWPWALSLVLVANAFIGPMATDFSLPAYPDIAADFGVRASDLQITLFAFLLPLALGQVVVGGLSDLWGRRVFSLGGCLLLGIGSLVAAIAPSLGVFELGRVTQGLGAAASIVAGRAMVADLLRGNQAARVFGLIGMLGGVGPIVAPAAGAWVLRVSEWQTIFWVTAMTQIGVLFVVLRVPETLKRSRDIRRLTYVEGIRTALRRPVYVSNLLVVAATFCVLFSYIAASPIVLLEDLGASPMQYAVVFAINGAGLVICSLIAATCVVRFGAARLVLVGLWLLSGGAVTVALVAVSGIDHRVVLIGFFLVASGSGVIVGNATGRAVGAVPEASGTAVALLGGAQFAAAALAPLALGLGSEHLLTATASVAVAACVAAWSALAILRWVMASL